MGDICADLALFAALISASTLFGFENMTGADFQKIANKQGDKLQFEINQFIPGTDSYEMAQISNSINANSPFAKNQTGTSVPGAPTPPTTTVAYQQAQSAAQGSSGATSTVSPGGKVPQFSAAAKLSPHKVKVLGISR